MVGDIGGRGRKVVVGGDWVRVYLVVSFECVHRCAAVCWSSSGIHLSPLTHDKHSDNGHPSLSLSLSPRLPAVQSRALSALNFHRFSLNSPEGGHGEGVGGGWRRKGRRRGWGRENEIVDTARGYGGKGGRR